MKYYSFHEYCRNTFGCKVYKLSLDAGFTCPNRDGTLSRGGCIFCSGGGGRFAVSGENIGAQLEAAKAFVKGKGAEKYIAYFQAYTNTYAPVETLRELFTSAIQPDDIVALDIATRPDCLSGEVLDLLSKSNRIKPVFVELGLQTAHEKSAAYINRCFTNECYVQSVNELRKRKIHTVTHLIFGLPGESEADILSSVRFAVESGTNGVKFHMLNILEGTAIADDYAAGKFSLMSREAYAKLVAKAVAVLPRDVVVHRLTGDGDKRILIAPDWVKDKKKTLNLIRKEIENT